MVSQTNAMTAARSPLPSLFKLISGVPAERLFRQPADALVIIGRQLELIVQDDRIPADLALGTLRFSLFQLHQGRIAQLASVCRSVTVYGEADVAPPQLEGVEFVALPAGSPLTQEWFLIVDSPDFWGGLFTRIVPERSEGRVRRYQFEGALTADERTISRAMLLLNLVRQQTAATPYAERDRMGQAVRWGRVAYALYTHSEAERLNLAASLHELPDLLEVLHACSVATPTNFEQQVLPVALHVLDQHQPDGSAIYRLEQDQLIPVVWHSSQQPAPLSAMQGLAAQALQQRAVISQPLQAGSPEHHLLNHAQVGTAVPLIGQRTPWGVLLVGHHDPTVHPSQVPAQAVSVGSLLSEALAALALGENSPPVYQSPYQPPYQPPAAPAAPAAPAVPAAPVGAVPPPSAYTPPRFGAPPAPVMPGVPALPTPPAVPGAPPASVMPGAPALPTPPAAPGAPASNGSFIPKLNPPAAAATPAGALPAPAGDSSAFGLPAWMRSGGGMLPPPGVRAGAATPPLAPTPITPATSPLPDANWNDLQRRLMSSLVAFDRRTADAIWQEAVSQYRSEEICTELLMPVMVAVGEGWHRGEVSVAAEHFSSRFIEIKMLNLLHDGHDNPQAPLAVIGCAQSEQHEIGAIMLALFMRWSGFRVIYLGQNVPNSTLPDMIRQLRPRLLGLSATTVEAAHNLTEVGHILGRMEPPVPQFIFGGMAFYERPDLIGRINGMFLEGSIRDITHELAKQHGVRK